MHAASSAAQAVDRILQARDLYEVLDLPAYTDDVEEIRRARNDCALLVHPDKNDSPDASEAFKRVQGAYEVLMSTHKAAYDDDLRRMQEDFAADKGETSEEEWSYRFGDLTASVVRAVTGNQDYEFGDWTRGLARRISQYRFGDITRSVISSLAAR